MRLVMDLLFVEELEFAIPTQPEGAQLAQTWSREEALTQACAAAGLELVDYGSGHWLNQGTRTRVFLYSKAWLDKSRRFGRLMS